MNSKTIITIDLGSSHISAMAVEILEDNTVRVLGVESKPADDIRYGIIEQMTGAAYKINELTRLLQNSARIPEIQEVCISIGARTMKQVPLTITRQVGGSRTVSDALIASMIEECRNKITQPDVIIYDIIPLSYELDGKKTDEPTGKQGAIIKGKYNIIVGSEKIKNGIERCFERTGIKLIDYTPLSVEALGTALLQDEERENGCALINMGASTTTLSIFADGALQELQVTPLGGKNITKDIQELGINAENAERLKCLKGVAMEQMVQNPIYVQIPAADSEEPAVKISTKFLASIIEARLEEIFQPIIRTIENSPYEIKQLILAGSAAKLTGIQDFIYEKFGFESRYGDHSDWLCPTSLDKHYDPAYAQQIGTALLVHEYMDAHPIQELTNREPKIKKRKLFDRMTDRVFQFFEDDNPI